MYGSIVTKVFLSLLAVGLSKAVIIESKIVSIASYSFS